MLELLRADITTLPVDAIVNAATPSLLGGGGVDGAIHRAAGAALVQASARLGPIEPGQAVITPGFRLPARYVIHTVGPIWRGGTHGEPERLRTAYENAFTRAHECGDIRTIAFPAISTGAYGFPKGAAAAIAIAALEAHAAEFDRVIACAFDDETLTLYRNVHAGRAR